MRSVTAPTVGVGSVCKNALAGFCSETTAGIFMSYAATIQLHGRLVGIVDMVTYFSYFEHLVSRGNYLVKLMDGRS